MWAGFPTSAKLFLSGKNGKNEHRTSNVQHPILQRRTSVEGEKIKRQRYDLEERIIEYSVRIMKIVEQLQNTREGKHVAGQLLKSGTSLYANHGEAQAVESPKDFIPTCIKTAEKNRNNCRTTWRLSTG